MTKYRAEQHPFPVLFGCVIVLVNVGRDTAAVSEDYSSRTQLFMVQVQGIITLKAKVVH